jgi:hypothetical protein
MQAWELQDLRCDSELDDVKCRERPSNRWDEIPFALLAVFTRRDLTPNGQTRDNDVARDGILHDLHAHVLIHGPDSECFGLCKDVENGPELLCAVLSVNAVSCRTILVTCPTKEMEVRPHFPQ